MNKGGGDGHILEFTAFDKNQNKSRFWFCFTENWEFFKLSIVPVGRIRSNYRYIHATVDRPGMQQQFDRILPSGNGQFRNARFFMGPV
jgi:hypothetical protein